MGRLREKGRSDHLAGSGAGGQPGNAGRVFPFRRMRDKPARFRRMHRKEDLHDPQYFPDRDVRHSGPGGGRRALCHRHVSAGDARHRSRPERQPACGAVDHHRLFHHFRPGAAGLWPLGRPGRAKAAVVCRAGAVHPGHGDLRLGADAGLADPWPHGAGGGRSGEHGRPARGDPRHGHGACGNADDVDDHDRDRGLAPCWRPCPVRAC
jgi:hypothetical protein